MSKSFICDECFNHHNPTPKQLECLRGKVPPSEGPICGHKWVATLQRVVYDDNRIDLIHKPGECPRCGSLWYLLLNQKDFQLNETTYSHRMARVLREQKLQRL